MNRDDLIRIALEAKLFDAIDGCENCFMRIPNFEAVERFAMVFFQAARKEMIKEGWRFCAEGQHTTQFCGLAEEAVLAEREACAKLCEEKETYGDPVQCWLDDCAASIRARGDK